jgi:hypothetical protein
MAARTCTTAPFAAEVQSKANTKASFAPKSASAGSWRKRFETVRQDKAAYRDCVAETACC